MSPREDVVFYSDGLRLSGWLTRGQGTAARPAVVFCPGFTGTKYAAFYGPYVDAFAAAGYTVLLIDYRGWGASEGDRGAIFPLQQAEDIRSALSYLERREDVDPRRLGLFGVSFGGGHASYVASVDQRVRCAVSVSGVADGAVWLRGMRSEEQWNDLQERLSAERTERAATGHVTMVDPTEEIMIASPQRRATTVKGSVPTEMVPDRSPLHCAQAIIDYRPVEAVAARRPSGILWLAVEGDTIVPVDHSRRMYAAAREPKRLVILPGEKHYAAYVEQRETIVSGSLAWYDEHLRR
jgi:uncharacterized protein